MAVHFFGEGTMLVAGTKAGFDVADADFFLEGDEGGCKSRGGISLNEEPIGADFVENGGKSFENTGGEFERRLIFLHEI